MPLEHHLRILHLSDLHERAVRESMTESRKAKVRISEADRRRVLDESNFEHILRNEIGKIDLVCFTGDAADWGLAEEFAKATARVDRILKTVGVGREALFVIPGNHDIDRGTAKETWSEMRELAAKFQKPLSDWMAGSEPPYGAQASWREEIARRSADFWKWVGTDLGRASLLPSNNSHKRLGYAVKVHGLDLPFDVHVLGFDSAWLCGDDNDTGKLRVTGAQIDLLARDTNQVPFSGFRVALVHHPLSNLADHKECYHLLAATTDLVLHGHQHDPIAQLTLDPDRELMVVATGSLYAEEGDRWINSFHVIDACLDDLGRPLRYRVTFWGWSEQGHWHRTGAIYKNAKDGVLELPVGKHTKGPEAVRAPAATTDVPQELQAWYYIERPSETDSIRRLILESQRAVVAVWGMPGVGKSTLVAKLSKDPEVRRRYADGVLWATFGFADPQIANHLSRFLLATGTPQLGVIDIKNAAQLLSAQLKTKACLVVLDDVWRKEDVAPFRASIGPDCAVVITTRDLAVAEAFDARWVELPAMKRGEASALIQKLIERSLSEEETMPALQVAELVGYLPLALWLVCARIREGESWGKLCSDLEDERHRLRVLEQPEEDEPDEQRKKRSLVAAFNLSLRLLKPEQATAFSLLSLLAEDVAFAPEVAASLWSSAVDQADKQLRLLFRKGLALSSTSSDAIRIFRLHDEQWNAARRILGHSGLEAHDMLVALYRRRAPSNSLPSLKDDGYIHDHLVWHLIGAGRLAELRELLDCEQHGENGWFLAREQRLDGYLQDLARAAAVEGPQRQARYAMMESSVASIGANVPFGVVEELLKKRIWSDERALAWALSQPPAGRFASLAAVARSAAEPGRSYALDAALERLRQAPEEGNYGKTWMFGELPIDLPENKRAEVLQIAKQTKIQQPSAIILALRHFAAAEDFEEIHREIEGLPFEPASLIALLPVLPAKELEWIRAIGQGDHELAMNLAIRFIKLGEPDRALDLIKDLPDYFRAEALKLVAVELDIGHLRQAEILAKEISQVDHRYRALGAVTVEFEEPDRTDKLTTLWEDLGSDYSKEAEYAEREIIPHLPGPLLQHAVAFQLSEIDSKRAAAERLAKLGYVDAAARLLEKSDEFVDGTMMEAVAPYLLEKHFIQLGVTDPNCDGIFLGYMLPRWAELGHGAQAIAALSRVPQTQANFRSRAAAAMAPYLNSAQLALLRAACERVEDRPVQLRLLIELATLAPQELTGFLFDAELEKAASPASIHQLAKALSPETALQLRAFLKSPVLKLVVCSALAVPPADLLVEDVTAAHKQLGRERADAKDKGLGDQMDLWNEHRSVLKYFARALEAATESNKWQILMTGRDALHDFGSLCYSPEEFAAFWPAEKLLLSLRSADVTSDFITGLTYFAALLPVDDAKEVEDIVLKLGATITEHNLVEELGNAPSITPRLLQFALDGARRIGAEDAGLTWCGSRLTMHLARAGRVVEAIEIARLTEKYDIHRLNSLVGLATELPSPHYIPFLQEAWHWITTPLDYHRNWNDADELRKLAPRAIQQPKPTITEFWQKAVRFVASQPRPDSWNYLAALAPVICELAGPQGVLETWEATRDVSRWWP